MKSQTALRYLRRPKAITITQLQHKQVRYLRAFGYEQVKALAFSEHGEPNKVLTLHQHSISPIAATSGSAVSIRFLASPINPADVNQIQGTYPSKPAFTSDLGSSTPLAIPGNEGVAEVTAVGPDAKRKLAIGNWVIPQATSFGTWRTHALTTADRLLKIEDQSGLTPLQVATVTVNPCTAVRMLKSFVSLKEGEWFIQNAGNSGVGRAAIQLGKAWGYRSINIVRHREGDEMDKMREELVGIGADAVITDQQLGSKDAKDLIESITGGERPRLGLNSIGGQATLDMAKQMEKGGHIVTYGAMSRKPLTIPASLLIFKDLHFDGFWLSAWGDRFPDQKKETIDSILKMYREGKFKEPPVEEVKWDWNTKLESLVAGVDKVWESNRYKGVFVFGKT
jgi:mitochondrial enoyl-[acyl-carrier protein] reductase / trans-2-enoyl-CoA reductase